MRETNFEYIAGEKAGCFSSSEQKWINKIKKYAKDKPDEVQIIAENKDGSIVAHIPVKWFKVSPPRRISNEQQERLRDNLQKYRGQKNVL